MMMLTRVGKQLSCGRSGALRIDARRADALALARWLTGIPLGQAAYERNVVLVLEFDAKLLQLLYHQLFKSYSCEHALWCYLSLAQ